MQTGLKNMGLELYMPHGVKRGSLPFYLPDDDDDDG